VHAVIWFSDLRNSTRLADSMPRRKFLALLDEFFDCTAGAVLEQGGEVLRFIGDASLAIFPISEADAEASQIAQQAARACESALSAALEAQRRMQEANARRTQGGESRLDLGVGLHVGDVMYGNIGTADRLEFSVIGAAANEAARIEAMCKTLEVSPIVSAAFAGHVPDRLRLARAPCAAWCCRAAGAIHPPQLNQAVSRRASRDPPWCWHGKRCRRKLRQSPFPFRIPGAHRCHAPGLRFAWFARSRSSSARLNRNSSPSIDRYFHSPERIAFWLRNSCARKDRVRTMPPAAQASAAG
jgi:class 3 adenylate cyclase